MAEKKEINKALIDDEIIKPELVKTIEPKVVPKLKRTKKKICKPAPTVIPTFLSEAKKEIAEQNKKIAQEKRAHKIEMAIKYAKKMLTLKYWIDFIQSFEELFTVLFINIQMLLIVTSAVFAIYFIYKVNWIMSMTSAFVYFVISFVLDKMNSSENKSKGEGE